MKNLTWLVGSIVAVNALMTSACSDTKDDAEATGGTAGTGGASGAGGNGWRRGHGGGTHGTELPGHPSSGGSDWHLYGLELRVCVVHANPRGAHL